MKIIIGFSFGRRGNWPNLSTQAIAKLIEAKVRAKRHDFVVIAQWEVAQALSLYGVECDHVVWSREGGGYLRTVDVASSATGYIAKQLLEGSKEVIVAAHPDHIERCCDSLRNGWLPEPKPLTDPNMAYDPRSNQVWVRWRWLYLVREFVASIVVYPFMKQAP